MIVAAGLGTRLRPLTELRPKPALPVRGLPLIAYQLELLARHGVSEAIVNVHHLPQVLIDAARACCPPGMEVSFSHEEEILDTGGGIRKAMGFLRESDPCLIIGGDMLLDADLSGLVAGHRERADAITMLLRRGDPREPEFGSVGVDDAGRVRRIGSRFDLGGSRDQGIYVWANVVSARAFDAMPDREVFSHFAHWIWPMLEGGARDVRGEVTDVTSGAWEPVGTPEEYLAVNLHSPALSYLDADARARAAGAILEPELVIGAGAKLGAGARLQRAVVWDGEEVPAGFQGESGVFAGGRFHSCGRAVGVS